MVDENTLREIVRRITAVSQPTRIILFGSQGRGQADVGSDLDLMIVQPQVANRYDEMTRLYKALGGIEPGVDILLYSEAEFQRRSRVPGTVLYWARKEGEPLYAAPS